VIGGWGVLAIILNRSAKGFLSRVSASEMEIEQSFLEILKITTLFSFVVFLVIALCVIVLGLLQSGFLVRASAVKVDFLRLFAGFGLLSFKNKVAIVFSQLIVFSLLVFLFKTLFLSDFSLYLREYEQVVIVAMGDSDVGVSFQEAFSLSLQVCKKIIFKCLIFVGMIGVVSVIVGRIIFNRDHRMTLAEIIAENKEDQPRRY
jgi:flagellar biosynthesis protein FlhB